MQEFRTFRDLAAYYRRLHGAESMSKTIVGKTKKAKELPPPPKQPVLTSHMKRKAK